MSKSNTKSSKKANAKIEAKSDKAAKKPLTSLALEKLRADRAVMKAEVDEQRKALMAAVESLQQETTLHENAAYLVADAVDSLRRRIKRTTVSDFLKKSDTQLEYLAHEAEEAARAVEHVVDHHKEMLTRMSKVKGLSTALRANLATLRKLDDAIAAEVKSEKAKEKLTTQVLKDFKAADKKRKGIAITSAPSVVKMEPGQVQGEPIAVAAFPAATSSTKKPGKKAAKKIEKKQEKAAKKEVKQLAKAAVKPSKKNAQPTAPQATWPYPEPAPSAKMAFPR